MAAAIPFRMTVCGIDELAGHCEAGASHVLSILDPDWPLPDAFATYAAHRKLELRFNDVIEVWPDGTPPRQADVAALLAFGRDLASEPAGRAPLLVPHLLVHCHAGVSRSTASMALIAAQAVPAMTAPDVFDAVLRVRPQAWPNLLIVELGDALLGRGGALVAAAHGVYRRRLAERPELAEEMTRNGRGREVAAATG